MCHTAHELCSRVALFHLGFLSGQVVSRKKWSMVVNNEPLDDFFNCWLLVYIIGKILEDNDFHWQYVSDRLVAYRSGNDSFAQRAGLLGRQKIAHEAFPYTIEKLFGKDSCVYRNVLTTLINDRMARNLAVIKANGCNTQDQIALFFLYAKKYKSYPLFWIKVAPVFLVPNFSLSAIRKLYFLRKI